MTRALPQADLSKPVGLNRKDFIVDLELDSVEKHFLVPVFGGVAVRRNGSPATEVATTNQVDH
jgi:hypothetical protein